MATRLIDRIVTLQLRGMKYKEAAECARRELAAEASWDLLQALKYALKFMPPSADTSPIHRALDKAEGVLSCQYPPY